MRIIVVSALALKLSLGLASAQDEPAINARLKEFFAAIAMGDAKRMAASYQENAVRALGTSVTVGRAAIQDTSEERFVTGGIEVIWAQHAVSLLSSTTAIVHGNYEVPNATPPAQGHMMLTFVKEGDDWLIAAVQTAQVQPQ